MVLRGSKLEAAYLDVSEQSSSLSMPSFPSGSEEHDLPLSVAAQPGMPASDSLGAAASGTQSADDHSSQVPTQPNRRKWKLRVKPEFFEVSTPVKKIKPEFQETPDKPLTQDIHPVPLPSQSPSERHVEEQAGNFVERVLNTVEPPAFDKNESAGYFDSHPDSQEMDDEAWDNIMAVMAR